LIYYQFSKPKSISKNNKRLSENIEEKISDTASPPPSFFPPLFSSLLAAAVKRETPGWLGFRHRGRGGFIGGVLGFLARTPKKDGGDVMVAEQGYVAASRAPRLGFSWARSVRARGGNRGRPRGQTRASAGQVAGGRCAPRVGAECRGKSRGEARLREEKGKADRRDPPVSGCWRRTGVRD